jgi:CheY-like chemotaxis protein
MKLEVNEISPWGDEGQMNTFKSSAERMGNKPAIAIAQSKILIVDDDPDLRRLLGVLLASEGHHVQAAEDGERAMVLLYDFKADIVLMDVGLPGMTGLELIRLIRLTRAERIPIVAVSGNGTAHAVQDAYEAGCDEYISKPVNNLNFASRVAQHLAIPFVRG